LEDSAFKGIQGVVTEEATNKTTINPFLPRNESLSNSATEDEKDNVVLMHNNSMVRRFDQSNFQLGALSRDKTALSTGRIGGINLKTKQHR
jgi:hypothetical protein